LGMRGGGERLPNQWAKSAALCGLPTTKRATRQRKGKKKETIQKRALSRSRSHKSNERGSVTTGTLAAQRKKGWDWIGTLWASRAKKNLTEKQTWEVHDLDEN